MRSSLASVSTSALASLLLPSLLSASLLSASLLLTGCSSFNNTAVSAPVQVPLTGLHGMLHGGQQPVSNSTIQLYQVGTADYGVGATPLLSPAVMTDPSGNFILTNKYTCTLGTQLYIVATGGNPGFPGGANNTALAMMAGLGLCDNLNLNTTIFINEITTVGAVWALSPFMKGTAGSVVVGAPGTNQAGLATAFADIAQISNNATGATPGTALPAGAVAPVAEINTLADILSGCVNAASNTTGTCPALFMAATPPGGSAPANTIAAALNIARNPGNNVGLLLPLAQPTSPFQPTLPAANDFTLGVTYTVGSAPASVAVDSASNIWVANNAGSSVSKLTHAGVPTTYTSTTGGINLPTAIAIDGSNNAWVANTSNSLTMITAAGAGTNFTGGLNAPKAVAIDPLGMVWVANGGSTTLSVFTSTGAVVPGSPFTVAPANGTGELAIAINPR